MYKDHNCVSMILNRLPLVPLQKDIVPCNWCGLAPETSPDVELNVCVCVCCGGLEVDPHCVVQGSNFDNLTKLNHWCFFCIVCCCDYSR
jgi:hypothetical protein